MRCRIKLGRYGLTVQQSQDYKSLHTVADGTTYPPGFTNPIYPRENVDDVANHARFADDFRDASVEKFLGEVFLLLSSNEDANNSSRRHCRTVWYHAKFPALSP